MFLETIVEIRLTVKVRNKGIGLFVSPGFRVPSVYMKRLDWSVSENMILPRDSYLNVKSNQLLKLNCKQLLVEGIPFYLHIIV